MKRRDIEKLKNQIIVAGAIGNYCDVWNLSRDLADSILNMSYDLYMECLDALELRAQQLYIENLRTPIKELIIWINNDLGTDYCADLLCASGYDLRYRLYFVREYFHRKYYCDNPVVARMVELLVKELLENVSRETFEGKLFWED